MPEQTTVIERDFPYIDDKDKSEENQDDIEVISIKVGKLLKLKHKIKVLKAEALNGYSKELKELKLICNNTNALLGELNDEAGRTKSG